MSIHYEQGDILDHVYIVHQCNCLTVHPHGLSSTIAKHRRESDVYQRRRAVGNRNLAIPEDRGVPGTIKVYDTVICLLAQWRPGRIGSRYFHRYPESNPPETKQQRELWFEECLGNLATWVQSKNIQQLPFPDHIRS